MSLNNPYYHHPQLVARQVADDVFLHISQQSAWRHLFEQGKMLGILIVEAKNTDLEEHDNATRVHFINKYAYLVAYSGVINGLIDAEDYFVPPVYDLQSPDDFYLQKDKEITELNAEIDQLTQLASNADKQHAKILKKQIEPLKNQRRQMSIELQKEIFSHFSFINSDRRYRNIIDIFADAKRGLPPGGSGECAAPRLLQYAYQHDLKPVELVEFWYGRSPLKIQRIHGQFYPSCIEKCSPILSYMTSAEKAEPPHSSASFSKEDLRILFEDETMLAVLKPKGLLSVPAKDEEAQNLEMFLHQLYPQVKSPMLAHRLDQATSGVMLAAKNNDTYKQLQQQFAERTTHKRYIADIQGELYSQCGIIYLPLTVNPDDRPRQVVDWQYGKEAATYYEVISRHDGFTRIALYPLTGRTHQLRVHCASRFGLDAPILGDSLYDFHEGTDDQTQNKTRCLRLHAESISFIHPVTGEKMYINCPE